MHVPISVYIGRDHESGAGAQKWRQIGCDSESPLPVMRESKRRCYWCHPRVSSSKMAHSKNLTSRHGYWHVSINWRSLAICQLSVSAKDWFQIGICEKLSSADDESDRKRMMLWSSDHLRECLLEKLRVQYQIPTRWTYAIKYYWYYSKQIVKKL